MWVGLAGHKDELARANNKGIAACRSAATPPEAPPRDRYGWHGAPAGSPLFVPQRDDRIDAHRPPRRDRAGGERDEHEQARDRREGREIVRGHAEQETPDQASQPQRP